MTKFDLFDSIGNVDDELIEKAIEPKKSSKKAFLAITSVAACAVFLMMSLSKRQLSRRKVVKKLF